MAIGKKCIITRVNMRQMCIYFEIMSHFEKFNVYSHCNLTDLSIYYMAKMIIELRPDIEESDSTIAVVMNIIQRYIIVNYKVFNM